MRSHQKESGNGRSNFDPATSPQGPNAAHCFPLEPPQRVQMMKDLSRKRRIWRRGMMCPEGGEHLAGQEQERSKVRLKSQKRLLPL